MSAQSELFSIACGAVLCMPRRGQNVGQEQNNCVFVGVCLEGGGREGGGGGIQYSLEVHTSRQLSRDACTLYYSSLHFKTMHCCPLRHLSGMALITIVSSILLTRMYPLTNALPSKE